MKNVIIFFILGILGSGPIKAMDLKGSIITNNDSVINVTFKLPKNILTGDIKFYRVQGKVKYYNKNGHTKRLLPGQVKEIRFIYNNEEVRFISLKDNLNLNGISDPDSFVFLRLETTGKMKQYIYYDTNTYGFDFMRYIGPRIVKVLQIENGDLFVPGWFNNFKKITKYLEGCPDLVKKINENYYNSYNFNDLVKDYNNCNCQK